MSNVTAIASGGGIFSYGVNNNNNSSPSMSNVTAIASGGGNENYGVYNSHSSARIEQSHFDASGGGYNNGLYNIAFGGTYTVTVDSSTISGSTYTIYSYPGFILRVGASKLVGGLVVNSGTLTCTASYDGNNKRLGADCTRRTKEAIVGLTDGDYTSIQAALNDVAAWCGTPSASNKCLVRVLPGTYSGQVTMAQYVDIEGSGELATKLTFTGSSLDNTGTVRGASNAELRSLTVENTGGATYAIAIYNSGASPSLRNVTASVFGGFTRSVGVYNISSSAPTLTNVTSSATGSSDNRAVLNDGSSPRIVDSNLSSSGGSFNFGITSHAGGTVTIDQSKITGSSNTIFNDFGVTTRVGASQLSGGPVFNAVGGTLTCTGVYDENYVSPGLNVCP
jgi:hypothetical protein